MNERSYVKEVFKNKYFHYFAWFWFGLVGFANLIVSGERPNNIFELLGEIVGSYILAIIVFSIRYLYIRRA
jgi:hypothetical protein